MNGATNALVDDMTYYYKGNQLDAISDNAVSSYKPFGFVEQMAGITTGEYTYDANGNMDVDQNKGLVGPFVPDPKGVMYNYLNLPKEVRLGQKKIHYTYAATGVKLRKTVYDQSGTEISRTNYVGGIQYEGASPQLKFVATAEGRVVKDGTSWNYEYFHKDHLGNTRVVYGYQKQVDEYKATMETSGSIAAKEENQFENIATTRAVGFNHTPASQDITTPAHSAETNGNTGKAIGPAKMLQVSSGDRVQMEVFARYTTATGANNNVITTLASAVTGAFGVVNAGETVAAYQALNDNLPAAAAAINRNSGVAKAYLFYILFDNNYVYKQFGYQALTSAALITHERLYLDVTVPDNGYMYIYVANESNVNTSTSVYFDDLGIVHQRTSSALQVLQTTDYYPFGLAINSSSYQKQTSPDNDYLYNGKELQDDHDLGWTDYGARMYMADIGRWGVIDPLTELSRRWNPYAYAYDNPIRYIDPDGMYAGESDPIKEKAEAFHQSSMAGPIAEDNEGNRVYGSDIKASYNVTGVEESFTEERNTRGAVVFRTNEYILTVAVVQQDGPGDPFWNPGGYPAWKIIRDGKDISDPINYPDVKIYETPLVAKNTAVTLPGIGILIHPDIKGTSRTKVLQHEYGHFLDYMFSLDLNLPSLPGSVSMPIVNFYVMIGVPSIFNAATGFGGDHSSYWTEIRANQWAEAFFGSRYIPDSENYPTK